MDQERIVVRNVRGRHAHRAIKFDADAIEATVQEECRIVRVRLDDANCPEFWIEVTLEIER